MGKEDKEDKIRFLDDGAKLPTGKSSADNYKDKLAQFQQELNMRMAYLPFILQSIKIDVKLTRAKYDALLEEKFTVDQAIELCKGK